MTELAKAIQKKYINDLTAKYPLHNFLILFLFLLSLYIYNELPSERILPALGNINVNFLFNFNNGVLSKVTLEDLLVSVSLTIAVNYLYTLISRLSFRILSKSDNFEKYTLEIESRITESKSSNDLVNYYVSKDISSQLNKKRETLKNFHIKAEIVLSFLFIFIIRAKELILIDWILIFSFIGIIFLLQWRLFLYYVSDFMPYYISEKCLLNGKYKFGDQ